MANTSKRRASQTKRKKSSIQKKTESSALAEKTGRNFPIVGIGASAGGLEAFSQLLKHLPDDTGMAFVLVQHLDPKHESRLAEVLSRVTQMEVSELRNGDSVKQNHVYIIPPNADIELSNGFLKVLTRKPGAIGGIRMPVDQFFRSLAKDQKSKAIGIILSGTGTDGTMGTQEIKEHGGITFVQEEKSAKYGGMPRSAILGGSVDFILTVEQIAEELKRIEKHPYVATHERVSKETKNEEQLGHIFLLLRKQMQVDFSHYRRSTIERRILRRMAVNKVQTLADYLKLIQEKPAEVQALFQDILIKVTGFFRDPATFQALKSKVFPKIIGHRRTDDPIRIWVPGCSTGEEAYSIAICLLEYLEKKSNFPIEIFATDVSDWAIERARSGQYVENIAIDVSATRLKRFFSNVHGGYQVNKSIRDICIFARHDITTDPPFSKLDMISCRNLLIYLEPIVQRRVLPIFHYSLKPHGYFLLGTSESVGSYANLFSSVDKKHKIYQKKHSAAPNQFAFAMSEQVFEPAQKAGIRPPQQLLTAHEIQAEADRIILGNYSPTGVIITEDMDIVQFRGQIAEYLDPPPGEATLNLLHMARRDLSLYLRTLILKAIKESAPVKREGIVYKRDGRPRTLNIEVMPIRALRPKGQYLLVIFEDITEYMEKNKKIKTATPENRRLEKKQETDKLRQELESTKEYLQAIIEEQEATNEELKSANEEIQSSNEELQSTNEELETNKEELQSANEELTTLNEELQNRNVELDQVNNDRTNLLASINVPILMLGNDLRIRWFTSVSQKIFNVIPVDVGRSITDMKSNLEFPDLERLIREAVDTLQVKEQEIQDKQGHWFLMRIRPYRTKENKIDGVVILFIDVDTLKRAVNEVRGARDFADAIVKTVRQPLVILDPKFNVVRVNEAFLQTFSAKEERTISHNFFEINGGQWNIAELQKRLEALVKKDNQIRQLQLHKEFQGAAGVRYLTVEARRIYPKNEENQLFLVAIDDITERKKVEEIAYHQTMLKEIHHRIKNNLQIISSLLHLQSNFIKDKKTQEMFQESQNRVKSMALIHEKLYQATDVSRIDFSEYARDLALNLQRSYGAKDIVNVEVPVNGVDMSIDTAVPCGLIVSELLSNALKYAFPRGKKGAIRINVEKMGDGSDNGSEYLLTVSDNGVGLPPDVDVRNTESLGLLLVRKLVDQLDGSMEVERDNGTTFRIHFLETVGRGGSRHQNELSHGQRNVP